MRPEKDKNALGRIFGRTYQVERKLGSGGMGHVYLVRHVRTGGMFALKTLLLEETKTGSEVYRRFQSEARTVSQLRHPNIVQVTDFNEDEDGTPFMVMEFLEGEDLSRRLDRVGKLSIAQVREIGEQIGGALQAAHDKGVIHRDVKPQNIVLAQQASTRGVAEVAKILDFGISKIRRSRSQMTRDQTIMGTPEYMSPEAATGEQSQIDGRSDQFSLATILYNALTGLQVFTAEHPMAVLWRVVHLSPKNLHELDPNIPESLSRAIERGMSKKKEDRFPTMLDFVRAACEIEAATNQPKTLCATEPPTPHPSHHQTVSRASWYQIHSRPTKTRYAVVAAGCACIVLVGLLLLRVANLRHGPLERATLATTPPSTVTRPASGSMPTVPEDAIPSAVAPAPVDGGTQKKGARVGSEPGMFSGTSKEEAAKQNSLNKKKGSYPLDSSLKGTKKNEPPATKRPDYHPSF